MPQIHAHLLDTPKPEHFDHLQQQLDPAVVVTTGAEVPSGAHILVTGRPSRQTLTACPDLRAVIIPFAGLPAQTRELMADFPHIAVHNLHHNAETTGEMAITLLMAAAKNLLPIDRAFRQHDWTLRYDRKPDFVLGGKTVLIAGYGAIGRYVGAVCRAMGMTVMGIRRTPDGEPNCYSPDALRDLLPQAHVLVVCMPGTPETEGWIGAAELARLPQDSIVINVGRGPVIDEGALYHALKDGHLYAAGIDVWYAYPTTAESRQNTPPSAYPFHELDNVVMSPHRGGAGGAREVEQRRMGALAVYLNAAARGDSIPHRVDVRTGY